MAKPVDPDSISEECRKRAAELGVDPVDYRRWERGDKIQAVTDAINAIVREADARGGK